MLFSNLGNTVHIVLKFFMHDMTKEQYEETLNRNEFTLIVMAAINCYDYMMPMVND